MGLETNKSRLLVVDFNVSRSSPAMKSWLAAGGAVLPQLFESVEVWSTACDLSISNLKFRRFAKIGRFWPIQAVVFRHQVRRCLLEMPAEAKRRTLIQSTGEMAIPADIRYMHYWNLAYLDIARKKPEAIRLSIKDRLFSGLAAYEERKCIREGATGEWWCVSRGLADLIRRDAGEGVYRVLPNAYDPGRFNVEARKEWRAAMRAAYGFSEQTAVFVFCSMGHFERKGLMQAIEAVEILKRKGFEAHLLVLGGSERALRPYRERCKDSRLRVVTFSGPIDPVEQHLAAGDALFFPSHFEAFALVEIEAAALGLRLYLTAHPGSEMILRDGVNGRLLPWDVEGMAAVLCDEIASGAILQTSEHMGQALVRGGFERRLEELYREAGAGVVAGV